MNYMNCVFALRSGQALAESLTSNGCLQRLVLRANCIGVLGAEVPTAPGFGSSFQERDVSDLAGQLRVNIPSYTVIQSNL